MRPLIGPRSGVPVGELPEDVREQLTDELIDELLQGKRGEQEILGRDGLLGDLTRRLVERALEAELTEHLGYEAGHAPPGGTGNARNGGTPKTLLTDHGPVRIERPRDRQGSYQPQIVRNGQRRLAGLDEKIIALYAGGMTTREIETYIAELYGPGVSRDTVSRVTAAVLEDAKAWQTRPLEALYPIVYLDALIVKIRDGQAVRNFACYLAIGVNTDGRARRARHVVPEDRGREVLARGPDRAQTARRQRRAGLLRRRPHGLPGGDRGRLPDHLGADVPCAPGPLEPALRALPRQEEGRRTTSGRSTPPSTATTPSAELEAFAETWDEQLPDDLPSAGSSTGSGSCRSWPSRPTSAASSTPRTRSRRSTARSARSSRPGAASPTRTPRASCSTSRSPARNESGGTPTTGASALVAFRIHFGDRLPDTAI